MLAMTGIGEATLTSGPVKNGLLKLSPLPGDQSLTRSSTTYSNSGSAQLDILTTNVKLID